MTTWAARLRDLVDDASPAAALRITRGRAYARSGRVSDVRARPGALSGRVQGSKAMPYLVHLGLPVLPDDAWELLVARVAGQVRHGARLLAGQVPDGLEEELAAEGVRLFPRADELRPECACDDHRPVCAHVTAIVEAAADVLSEDAFLLLRLRGRGREQVLGDLAVARRRGGDDDTQAVESLSGEGWAIARGPLPEAELVISAAPALAGRGDPPGWAGSLSAQDLFGGPLDDAAAWAQALLDP